MKKTSPLYLCQMTDSHCENMFAIFLTLISIKKITSIGWLDGMAVLCARNNLLNLHHSCCCWCLLPKHCRKRWILISIHFSIQSNFSCALNYSRSMNWTLIQHTVQFAKDLSVDKRTSHRMDAEFIFDKPKFYRSNAIEFVSNINFIYKFPNKIN